MTKDHVFQCPHCYGFIIVAENEFNCKIFRHGVKKESNEQIDPHASKSSCDSLVEQNTIYGCGKPFRIVSHNNNYFLEKCDYI